jgi:hypothetical protein
MVNQYKDLLNNIRAEYSVFESNIEYLIKVAEAKNLINSINADSFNGYIYEICKTFNGIFNVGDLYVYAEALAAKYPNYDRSSRHGDHIITSIRSGLAKLSKHEGLIERLGYDSYRVANKTPEKAVIYETIG